MSANNRQHLNYLDSARGIAALMVLFYHYIGWKWNNHLSVELAYFIFNGSDAVSFFFVLSGFVLSYKYIVLKEPLDFLNFFITRFFRLFPGFLVAVLINALYWNRHNLNLHMLYDLFIMNKQQFWEEIILFRSHKKFYEPGWSLMFELTISFFMPFMMVWAKKDRRLLWWFIPIAFLIGDWIIKGFFIHFALGLIACCYYSELTDPSFRETKWYKYRLPILSAAFILFSMRHIDRIIGFGGIYNTIADYVQLNMFHYTAIGSFIFLVALIVSKKTQRIFNHSILRFFGRISYGIYLIHWVIVQYIFDHWDKIRAHFPGTLSAGLAMLLLCLSLTIILSLILHYTVELPFIRIGKRICKKLRPSFVLQ